jgi:hypothetical protein
VGDEVKTLKGQTYGLRKLKETQAKIAGMNESHAMPAQNQLAMKTYKFRMIEAKTNEKKEGEGPETSVQREKKNLSILFQILDGFYTRKLLVLCM